MKLLRKMVPEFQLFQPKLLIKLAEVPGEAEKKENAPAAEEKLKLTVNCQDLVNTIVKTEIDTDAAGKAERWKMNDKELDALHMLIGNGPFSDSETKKSYNFSELMKADKDVRKRTTVEMKLNEIPKIAAKYPGEFEKSFQKQIELIKGKYGEKTAEVVEKNTGERMKLHDETKHETAELKAEAEKKALNDLRDLQKALDTQLQLKTFYSEQLKNPNLTEDQKNIYQNNLITIKGNIRDIEEEMNKMPASIRSLHSAELKQKHEIITEFKDTKEKVEKGMQAKSEAMLELGRKEMAKDFGTPTQGFFMDLFKLSPENFSKTWATLQGAEGVNELLKSPLYGAAGLNNPSALRELALKGRNQIKFSKLSRRLYNFDNLKTKLSPEAQKHLETLQNKKRYKISGKPDDFVKDYQAIKDYAARDLKFGNLHPEELKEILGAYDEIIIAATQMIFEVQHVQPSPESTPLAEVQLDARKEALESADPDKQKIAQTLDKIFPAGTEGQKMNFGILKEIFMSKEEKNRQIYYFDIENGVGMSVPEDMYSNLFSGEYGFNMLLNRDRSIHAIDQNGKETFSQEAFTRRINALTKKGARYAATGEYIKEKNLTFEKFQKEFEKDPKKIQLEIKKIELDLLKNGKLYDEKHLQLIRLGLLSESLESSNTYLVEAEKKSKIAASTDKQLREQLDAGAGEEISEKITTYMQLLKVELEKNPNISSLDKSEIVANLATIQERLVLVIGGKIDLTKKDDGTDVSGGIGFMAPISLKTKTGTTFTIAPSIGTDFDSVGFGVGGGVSQKIGKVQLSLGAFITPANGGVTPGGAITFPIYKTRFELSLGASAVGAFIGLNRNLSREWTQKTAEAYSKLKFDKLDAALNKGNRAEIEKALNESGYFANLKGLINSEAMKKNPQARDALIRDMLEFAKKNVQFEQAKDFKPTFGGLGVAFAYGSYIPIPVFKIIFGKQQLVHRMKTGNRDLEKLSTDKTHFQWLENFNQLTLEHAILGTTTRVGIDESGNARLAGMSESVLQLNNLATIPRLNEQLQKDKADLRLSEADETDSGALIQLDVLRAAGNIEYHVDPDSKIKLIYRKGAEGNTVFLATADAEKLYFTRQDFNYSYPIDQDNKTTHKTVITISDNPLESRQDYIKLQEGRHKSYQVLSARFGFAAEEKSPVIGKSQNLAQEKSTNNILSYDEFAEIEKKAVESATAESPSRLRRHTERISATESKIGKIKQDWQKLGQKAQMPSDRPADSAAHIKNTLDKMLDDAKKQKNRPEGFWKIYKGCSTFGYDFKGKTFEVFAEHAEYGRIGLTDLLKNYYNRSKPTGAKNYEDLPYEQQKRITNTILRESFTVAKGTRTKAEKRKELDQQLKEGGFNFDMLRRFFESGGENTQEAEQLTRRVRGDILKAFENNELPTKLEGHMQSVAGTQRIVGFRYSMDFVGELLGAVKYDLKSSDPEAAKIARIILEKNSPLPKSEDLLFALRSRNLNKESLNNHDISKIQEFLQAPLAMKVLPFMLLKGLENNLDYGKALNEILTARNANNLTMLAETLTNSENREVLTDFIETVYTIRYIQLHPQELPQQRYTLSQKYGLHLDLGDIETHLGAYERCDNATMITKESIHLVGVNVKKDIFVSDETILKGNYQDMMKFYSLLGGIMVTYSEGPQPNKEHGAESEEGDGRPEADGEASDEIPEPPAETGDGQSPSTGDSGGIPPIVKRPHLK